MKPKTIDKKNKCISCKFFKKKLSRGKYFILKCEKWGLLSQRIYPSIIVRQSIGQECPMYQKKHKKDDKISNDKNKNNNGNLDIIV